MDALDLSAALERMEGDEDLLRELAQLFLEDAPPLLSDIRDAVARRDGNALRQAAHSLKGAAGNLSAEAVYDVAKQLENAGHVGDWTHAAPLCAQLDAEFVRLADELALLS